MPERRDSRHVPAPLGVTVMPEWFMCEGIDAVLDRIQALGATAIATSPYVLEVAPDGEGGREPPVDGGAGRVRPLDRPLFGRHELWVRTAPAFAHDLKRYDGLRYQPSPATELTIRHADLIDRVVEAAGARGIEVLLQVMGASPPGYRVQFSGARQDDVCLGPDGEPHASRVDKNASLASPHVAAYTAQLVAELAERYPGVAGIRLDWPEYPPYDFRSALFDFNPAALALMAQRGHEAQEVARDVRKWADELRNAVREAATKGNVNAAFTTGPWTELFGPASRLAPLFDAKQEAALGLLRGVRTALDAVPGSRRRLELQAFPPPFHRISGFPLGALDGIADAVGIKLYTMHWPMLARNWARDLAGDSPAGLGDAITAALAHSFGFVDDPVDGASLHYPEPDEPHPVGARAQADKLVVAQRIAGAVPTIAFAHTYGPLEDVASRCAIAAASGRPVWLNRYGYLADAKLARLAATLRATMPGANACATSSA